MNKNSIKDRINNGAWQDAIPQDFIISPIEAIGTWQRLGNTSKDANNILRLLDNQEAEPASLSALNGFMDKIEAWVSNYEDYLTYPATMNGIEKALKITIEKEEPENVAFMYGIFHREMYKIYLDNKDELSNSVENSSTIQMFKNIEKTEIKNKIVEEKIEEPVLPLKQEKPIIKIQETSINENDISEETKEVKKNFSRTNDKIENEVKYFQSFFEKYNTTINDGFDNSIKNYFFKKHIDERIKEVSKDPNIDMNEWISSTLLLSISKLEPEQAKMIAERWPDWSFLQPEARPLNGLINNEDVLDKKVFWHSIKTLNELFSSNNDNDSIDNVYQKVLPSLVSIKDSNIEDKINIGKNILSWATKNENEFTNRLILWTKMGGDITEKNENGDNLVSFIASKKNDMWDKVIINYAKEKNISLNKNYPQHFKPKNHISITKDSSFANKNSPF